MCNLKYNKIHNIVYSTEKITILHLNIFIIDKNLNTYRVNG